MRKRLYITRSDWFICLSKRHCVRLFKLH